MFDKIMSKITGWKKLALANGAVSASYCGQRFTMTCVPTCISMLSWNLSYGLGLESSAIREAYIIAQPSHPRQFYGAPKYYLSSKTFDDMSNFYRNTGMKVNQVGTLLAHYGFSYTHHQNLEVKNALLVPKKLTDAKKAINNMGNDDAALLIAYGDQPHCLLLYKRNNYYVLLDPRDQNNCDATNAPDIAQVLTAGNDHIIFINVGQAQAPMITQIFMVPCHSLLGKIWNSEPSVFTRKRYLRDDLF